MCLMHKRRFDKYWSTELPIKPSYRDAKCKYCDRKVGEKWWGARWMCNRHYQNRLRHGDPLYIDKIKEKRWKAMTHWYYRATNWRTEHIIVMENKIWRHLNKWECIHHIDLTKTNNAIENLYLCKDRTEHNHLHQQLEKIAAELYKKWIITFKNWEYRLNERYTKV